MGFGSQEAILRGQVAKYLKIEADILASIKDGSLKPGDKLPGQSEMQRRYGVSAITVRKAFADLINDGYLVGVKGSGTYVAKPQMIRGLTSISFSEELREQGYEIDMVVDSIETCSNAAIAHHLDIDADSALTRVARVRMANGEPIAYQVSYVSDAVLSIGKTQDLHRTKSFYALLAEVGVYPRWVNETYSVWVVDDPHLCSSLGVEPGYPCFLVRRTTFDEENTVIEYAESFFNKDRYSVTVNIKA